MENLSDKKKQDEYYKIREEFTKAKLSNTEMQDKAILALPSAFLGFSISLIANQEQVENIDFIGFMICSWVSFGISIIVTLISFRLSQKAHDMELAKAEQYYIHGNEEAPYHTNIPARIVQYLNWISLVSFCLGLICTIVFVIIYFN